MVDKIQSYRQPLVTATGIILGFIFSFSSSFVKTESEKGDFIDLVIFLCVLVGITNLIIVLYRVLRMDYPAEKAEKYYHKTLKYFIFGVSISFTGVLIDMFFNFMID